MDQQPTAPRVISLDEAIAIALELQQTAQLTEAEALYRKILAVVPDHPEVLQFAGILAHQQGRKDEAVALLERSRDLLPHRAECHSNLGLALKANGRLTDAIAAYRRAIELDPDRADTHSNLGLALRALGKPVEAEAAFRTAIRLDPGHVGAYHNLGMLLAGRHRSEEAAECFAKAAAISPGDPGARRLLADAYCAIGHRDKAIEIYERWLAEEPGDPVAEHLLAACSDRTVPARGSDAYIEATYDEFASTFETQLNILSYRAPAIVEALLVDAGLSAARRLDVLDAGCGTGLCGSYLAPYARRLTGVDLSARMLARAGEKQVYDDLVKSELTAYLREHAGSFDLIVSADTLEYFGVLGDVARDAWKALRAGGLLVFTVEEWTDAPPSGEFCLRANGRYNHAMAYVDRVLRGAGFDPTIARVELRMEAGTPVAGLAVRAGRRP